MSRSGYTDDEYDAWATIRWRGAVAQAIRGRHGQAFLREMLTALDALPEKRLIADDLQDAYDPDCVCALGAVGRARSADMSHLDPYDRETVADTFRITDALAFEVMWINDDGGPWKETPEARFARVRLWIESHLRIASSL